MLRGLHLAEALNPKSLNPTMLGFGVPYLVTFFSKELLLNNMLYFFSLVT